MSKLVWVLQKNIGNKLTLNAIKRVLTEQAYPYIEIDLVPFAQHIPTDNLQNADFYIFWGAGFVPRASAYPMTPGIWYDEAKFRWSSFSKHWSTLMLSRDMEIIPYEIAIKRLSSEPSFMRPDADSKEFDGGVYSIENKPKLLRDNSNLDVVFGNVIDVRHEWRFFIVAKDIVAASSYRMNGQPSQSGLIPREAIDIVDRAVNAWVPADVFCLDIGYDGNKYGIIEANCFNASRHYGSDTRAIVRSVTEYTRQLPV